MWPRPVKQSSDCVFVLPFFFFFLLDTSSFLAFLAPFVFNSLFSVGGSLGFALVSAGFIPTPFSLCQIHLWTSIAFTDVFLPENMETACLFEI